MYVPAGRARGASLCVRARRFVLFDSGNVVVVVVVTREDIVHLTTENHRVAEAHSLCT